MDGYTKTSLRWREEVASRMLDFQQGKWRGFGVLYCHGEEKWGGHSLAYAIHNKGVLYSIKFCFRHTILSASVVAWRPSVISRTQDYSHLSCEK